MEIVWGRMRLGLGNVAGGIDVFMVREGVYSSILEKIVVFKFFLTKILLIYFFFVNLPSKWIFIMDWICSHRSGGMLTKVNGGGQCVKFYFE